MGIYIFITLEEEIMRMKTFIPIFFYVKTMKKAYNGISFPPHESEKSKTSQTLCVRSLVKKWQKKRQWSSGSLENELAGKLMNIK